MFELVYVRNKISNINKIDKDYKDVGYSLVWSDEFDYAGKVDSNRWNYDIGHGHNGWGNAESQYYSDELDHCRSEEGRLVIRCSIDKSDDTYYSSRINTSGKASWQYGRFEICAKIPLGAGTWPAIWMLPDDLALNGTPWPLCGEIDIMEHIGRDPGNIHFSLHSDQYNHMKKTQLTGVYRRDEILEGFHIYRMDWDEEGFSFFIDGHLLCQIAKGDKKTEAEWPFDKPYFLIINLAAGGYWGGEIDNDVLPACLEVDFVRVYQKN